MTCPVDDLDDFYTDQWDVGSLCSLMACPECTAGPGEGAMWIPQGPPDEPAQATADYDDIPF